MVGQYLRWVRLASGCSMLIAMGSDHAGYDLKLHLIDYLIDRGVEVSDLGTHSTQPVDYPPIIAGVASAVARSEADRGIVLGGTGQGEQITANKIPGIRAALCLDLYTARLSRLHNDANVLAIGSRVIAPELAEAVTAVWIDTEFEGGRHQRRIDQISQIERSGGAD